MAATGDGGFHATEDFAEPILPAQRQEEEGGSHSVAEPDVLPQPPVYSPEIFSTLTPAEAALIFSPSLVAIAALPAPPDEAPMARTGPRALSVCHEGDDSLGLPSDGVLDDSEVAPVPGASAPADLIGADEERRAKLQALALELPKSSVTKEAAQMFATVDPRFAEDENPKERIQREDTGTSGFFRRHESSLTRRESSGASAFGASIKRVVGSGAVEAPQRWSAKTGPDKVRRALMMDKAGAVARALGQPGFSAHMLKKERSFQKHADNDTTVQRERSLERSHAKSHTLSLGNLSHLFTRFLSQSKVRTPPLFACENVSGLAPSSALLAPQAPSRPGSA
ncbi:hypothetical protein T484DRAFT_1878823 [Baffinella frigidus]|nr:hypothetical protein T484DRAFT_1878823 [Cryptophyta sp. CCMP2293]